MGLLEDLGKGLVSGIKKVGKKGIDRKALMKDWDLEDEERQMKLKGKKKMDGFIIDKEKGLESKILEPGRKDTQFLTQEAQRTLQSGGSLGTYKDSLMQSFGSADPTVEASFKGLLGLTPMKDAASRAKDVATDSIKLQWDEYWKPQEIDTKTGWWTLFK